MFFVVVVLILFSKRVILFLTKFFFHPKDQQDKGSLLSTHKSEHALDQGKFKNKKPPFLFSKVNKNGTCTNTSRVNLLS